MDAIKNAAASGAAAFREDGAVGSQFKADGAIGGTAQAIGGPFDKQGAIGQQFTTEGSIGGTAQTLGEQASGSLASSADPSSAHRNTEGDKKYGA